MSGPMIPLILCGGAGTRLWPASREKQPKQFIRLFGAFSTFQETLKRVADPALFARPIIISNRRYALMIEEQLAEVDIRADVLLEPMRRDSAPAIAAGAEFARSRGGDPVIVTLAADHVVNDRDAFVRSCVTAGEAAEQGWIVTFGVRPERPATEYGYIQPAASIGRDVFAVERFVEKPNQETAKRYIADGYFWNSGNFLFRANMLLAEYAQFEPESAKAVAQSVAGAEQRSGCTILDEQSFSKARAISIDYAVMEKTKRAAVLPVSFGWSDVGSWQSVWELAPKDANENSGQGDAVFHDASGCYVTTHKPAIALFGVQNIVVVGTEDAVLVASRERVAEMKPLVEKLRKSSPRLVEEHAKVLHAWGSEQLIEQGEAHWIRRVVVKPGMRSSPQSPGGCVSHIVAVRGTVKIGGGPEAAILHQGESRALSGEKTWWLENPQEDEAELIEIVNEAVALRISHPAG